MNSYIRMLPRFAVLAILLSLWSVCDLTEVNPDEGRIVPGWSIDGVKFGDSKETVEARLGKRDGGGLVDGFRSWHLWCYERGPHAGMEIYFISTDDGEGPVDKFYIQAPFKGKTIQGIGIGSSVMEVRRAYGMPRETQQSEHGYFSETYCFFGRGFYVVHKDSTLELIEMGYYLPSPYDTLCTCR